MLGDINATGDITDVSSTTNACRTPAIHAECRTNNYCDRSIGAAVKFNKSDKSKHTDNGYSDTRSDHSPTEPAANNTAANLAREYGYSAASSKQFTNKSERATTYQFNTNETRTHCPITSSIIATASKHSIATTTHTNRAQSATSQLPVHSAGTGRWQPTTKRDYSAYLSTSGDCSANTTAELIHNATDCREATIATIHSPREYGVSCEFSHEYTHCWQFY